MAQGNHWKRVPGWVFLQVGYREAYLDATAKTGARNESVRKAGYFRRMSPLFIFQAKIDQHIERTRSFSTHQSRGQDILSPTAMRRWKRIFNENICGKGDGSAFTHRND